MDDQGFLNLEDILTTRQHILTLGKLQIVICTSPKARFQLTFPVYRVSGQGQRRFLIPEIGILVTQGHCRDDVLPEVLWASQERLRYNDEDSYNRRPRFCVHGTSLEAWRSILSGTRSPTPGGPERKRKAVHFCSKSSTR